MRTFGILFFSILATSLSVNVVASNSNNPSSLISVSGDREEVLWFRPDANLFTDRNYRLLEVPEHLKGLRFLHSGIDSTSFSVERDGRLLILTPVPVGRASSQAENLESLGFTRLDVEPFQLFGRSDIDRVLTYEKTVKAGETYHFDKWVVVLGFEEAQGAIDRYRDARARPFDIFPSNVPNTGILLVDQEQRGRSGHGGITLTECKNGDILAFFSVTWAESWYGHSVSGWSQFKRSRDGGLTWSSPRSFEPSREMWVGRRVYSGLVFSVITAPDGTLVATVVRYANRWWEKALPPVYFLSHDHGENWDGPFDFDENATVDDISMTLSTHFVHDGKIFIVFRGGTSNMFPGGIHTLWVSEDNGKSFQKRSRLPFHDADYYWAAGVLDNGEIIVYSYEAHHDGQGNLVRFGEREKTMPYVISHDGGLTWSEIQQAHFQKGIRNMQMSEKVGDFYFMHGRTGTFNRELVGDDPGPGSFVLYSSKDGINWCEGILLMSRQQTSGRGDAYSSNAVVGRFDPNLSERLMILGDVSYNGPRTNMHYWFVGTEDGALDYLKGKDSPHSASDRRSPTTSSREEFISDL